MIYLSGAMSCFHGTQDERYPFEWRDMVEDELEFFQPPVKAFNPTAYYNYDIERHQSEKEVMDYELYMLGQCKVVLVDLRRFNDSDGTKCELAVAHQLGLPIIAMGTEEEWNNIHPWFKAMTHRVEFIKDREEETIKSGITDVIDFIVYYYYESM